MNGKINGARDRLIRSLHEAGLSTKASQRPEAQSELRRRKLGQRRLEQSERAVRGSSDVPKVGEGVEVSGAEEEGPHARAELAGWQVGEGSSETQAKPGEEFGFYLNYSMAPH